MRKKEVENLSPTITRTHKIRIYPNEHNQEVFQKYYDYQRSVWNRAIDERNAQYKIYKEMKATGLYTQKELNKNYSQDEFKIFIYLVNKEVIEIDGDEGVGNGYYGSGFWVSVAR